MGKGKRERERVGTQAEGQTDRKMDRQLDGQEN